MCGSSSPFWDNLCALLFLNMHMGALTLQMVVFWGEFLIVWMMYVMRSLSGWSYWDEGLQM
jgi:hypothetical protein